jgi:hypothetical protein
MNKWNKMKRKNIPSFLGGLLYKFTTYKYKVQELYDTVNIVVKRK